MHWLAENIRALFEQLRLMNGCRIYGDLVGAGIQHPPHVADGAQPAAYAERYEYLLGYLCDYVDHCVPGLGGRPDIQEDQLVCAFLIIEGGQLDRVSGVAQVGKAGAFDDTAFGYVQAGYNAFS